MKVLLVEDDPDQLAIRKLLLESNGFEALAASDADSAARLAAAEHPQCAVVDVGLPSEDDGLALLGKLKQLDADLLLVVLSGSDPKRFASKPESRFVEAVFRKGNSSKSLLETLKKFAKSSNSPKAQSKF